MSDTKIISPDLENSDANVDWTPLELQEWVKAGLIPNELLEESNLIDLTNFILKNKKELYGHFRRNTDSDDVAIIPPVSDWPKYPDIIVKNKKTGEVVNTLQMTADFKITDDITLTVLGKELSDWEAETSGAKKFNKEQSETFKKAIYKVGERLTRKDIVTLIEEIRKPKKVIKYRQSGHLVDEKLKYTKSSQTHSPYPFDLLSPEIKKKIEESKQEVKAEGIKLTPPENKIVHALNQILHEKSQTGNPKSDDFYGGNEKPLLVPYGQNQEQKAAVLKFKPSDLYKAYMGKDKYSGADITFINNTLHQLESKKVLIKYDRIKRTTNGKKEEVLTERIERFESLIQISSFFPDLTSEEKERLDSGDNSIREAKGEIIIALHPIFTDQIDTKFIEFPIDTNRRLVIAAGGHKKVTSSMQTLMEWMLRDLSAKRVKTEINDENLADMLGLGKFVEQNRKKRLQERIDKDVQAMINMGIVLQAEKKPNSTGGEKWIFHLNKDYE